MAKKLTYIYLIPLAVIMSINALFSLRSTTFFELYLENEVPSYQHDHIWILLPMLALWIFAAWWIHKYNILDKVSYRVMCIFNCIYALVICLLAVWVYHCGVVCDAMHVSNVAVQFLNGDYQSFFNSTYFLIYPFQLHMAAYFQLVYTLFGAENYIAFEILNACYITLIMFLLQRITYELFEDELICKWEIIFSSLLFPLFLFTTFVYGDIPGFLVAVLATYFTIRYLKTNQWKCAVIAGICLALGVLVKENDAIFIIAVVIAIILKAMKDKNFRPVLIAIIVLALSQSGMKIVDQVYLNKAGMDKMPPGTPLISWMVMGIQDYGDENQNGLGWYNGYNINVFVESDYDYDVAFDKSVNSIKEAALEHIHNPGHAIYYYYRKFVSQWNDPTFQSLIMNEWYSRHVEQTPAWNFFNYGMGRTVLFHLMNIIHFIMFVFIAIGLIAFLKKWSLEGSFVLLCIFGGMLFHEAVWESKGRYVLPYYVLLVPFAAFGCVTLLRWIKNRMEMSKKGKE